MTSSELKQALGLAEDVTAAEVTCQLDELVAARKVSTPPAPNRAQRRAAAKKPRRRGRPEASREQVLFSAQLRRFLAENPEELADA